MTIYVRDTNTKGKREIKPVQLFEYEGFTFFVAEVNPEVWTLSEASSGCRVFTFDEQPNLTKQEFEKLVSERSFSNFQYCGKTLKQSVEDRIKQFGICNEL